MDGEELRNRIVRRRSAAVDGPAPTAAVRAVRLDTSVELMLERSKLHIGERVLATIVATAGSTYRKAGARMLVMADGT
jgi:hypothetical protein